MATNLITGKAGESVSAKWLKEQGFEVLNVNWRYSYFEIDLVTKKDDVIHFIEVKTRRTLKYGFPEESVSKKKFAALQNAAEQWLFLNTGHKRIQFDIVAIVVGNDGVEIKLIEDVHF